MATPPDQIRVGAPVGQTPPVPAEPAPPARGGPILQLPAPQGGAINVLTEQMAQRLASLMALAGTRELGRLGFNVVWNAQRPDIVERARQATDEMFGAIVGTAGQRVKDYFAQQLEAGKAPPEIGEALSEQFAGVPGRQARMVARTVTRQLYNEASLDAYEAAGVRHVIASDGHGGLTGKTDAGCLERNGKQFTLDEARAEEHSPTTHPNCTLSWRPVVPDTGLRSKDVIGDAVFEHDGHRLLTLVWEPDKHPRWPKGSPKAGEWMHTHDLLELLRGEPHGSPVDVSWIAHGAQRIQGVSASLTDDDHVQFHVRMRDGGMHVVEAGRDTPISTVTRALGAVDAATPVRGPHRERTVEKELRDIEAGERFRLVTDPTKLYRTYERVTRGASQRTDRRITVRNTETGKRVHMQPDRRIDHFVKDEPPATARVSELAKGDRFFVGDREYERITEGPSKRGDGRITGRELATGKRVHFKPDRMVERRRSTKPPDVKPPEPKPRRKRTDISPPKKPPVELPPEYESLPRRGDSLGDAAQRWKPPPEGYAYARVPASQWNDPKVKTLKAPSDRFGTGRIYGSFTPQPAHEGGVVVLVERQAHRKTPYMRDADVSFASISRKNVVAAWDAQGEQVFYRPPTVPGERKVKLVVGRRYQAQQIPEGSKVRYESKQWTLRFGEHGPSLHRKNDETGMSENALIVPEQVLTYGVVEQKPFDQTRIRSTEKVAAERLDQGEPVLLDGLLYHRTGITRRGDHVGVHLQLAGDKSAPIVRVPLDEELDVVRLKPPADGKLYAGRNLEEGDTFRNSLGAWSVRSLLRQRNGATRITAESLEDPGYIREFRGRDPVLPGHEGPAHGDRLYLWQIPDGEHFTQGGTGYKMLSKNPRAGQAQVENVNTGRDQTLHDHSVPRAVLGLPEGVTPLPPRVTIPGTRLRDFTGDKFSVGGVRYQRAGSSGPRGTISAYNLVGSDDERDQLHHFPGSTLIVPDGETDPYGSGARRAGNLISKAAEVYDSRRALQTVEEYQNVGGLVHEAMMTWLRDRKQRGLPQPTQTEWQSELREAISQIRRYGGKRFTVEGASGRNTDHHGNGVTLHEPNLSDQKKIEEAGRWFPDSWVDVVNADKQGTRVGVGVNRAFYRHFGSSFSNEGGRLVALGLGEQQKVVLHEFVHRVEHQLPELMRLAGEFWQRRTAGEPDVHLYGADDEVTKEDHFHQRYAGKRYGHRGGGEILSMGIEDLVHVEARMPDNRQHRMPTALGRFNIYLDDPDYAHFLLGVLAAYKTELETEQRVAG